MNSALSFVKKIANSSLPRSFILSKYFMSAVKKYCFHGEFASKNTIIARIIRYIFWSRYYNLPISLRLAFQEELMGGENSVNWAKHYQEQVDNFPGDSNYRIGTLTIFEAWPHLAYLNNKLKTETSMVTVIQLGASSGREIAWLAKENPNHKFIYSDIFDDVVAYAEQCLKIQNLSFCTASADNLHLITKYATTRDVIIFSSGSAQYIHPEHLNIMFKRILLSLDNKRAEICLGEPGAIACNPLHINGSVAGGNFGYIHNYSYYAEKNGWHTNTWNATTPYSNSEPEHRDTCHLIGIFSSIIKDD